MDVIVEIQVKNC